MKYNKLLDKLISYKFINPRKDNKISPWIERKISNELREEVIEMTSFLNSDTNLSDRISTMQLGITKKPTCLSCDADTRYHRSIKKYSDFCSNRCQSTHEITLNKRKVTNISKYGVETTLSLLSKKVLSDNGKNAAKFLKEWCEERNVSNVMDLPSVKEKHKKVTSSKEYLASRYKTIDEKYGSYSVLQDIKNKKMKWCEYREYDKNSLVKYRASVYSYTRMNDLASLKNYDKRGRLDLKPDAYHLEHKYSIFTGFKNNIHPAILGCMHNLEMIQGKENIRKSDECSISIGTLLCLIESENLESLNDFKKVAGF